jgi:hypothetical protein
MMTVLKFIAEKFVGKSGKGNPKTFDAKFLRNYVLANKRGSEDGLLMLNMMTGGKPRLDSTTEPREYRAPSEYCTESVFARDCLGAAMMGAWDAEVGRPIPEIASDAYRRSYAAKRDRMAAGNG